GGTGLGLAIVEQSTQLHGGQVHAENHAAGGLVVEIELPVAGRAPVAPRTTVGLPPASVASALTG
ncbi:MAG TPA: ATP-binding protein, partial [Polyangiaceae bacterium]|nr:ATP-binding protein [Polyangiaceae bacterium]